MLCPMHGAPLSVTAQDRQQHSGSKAKHSTAQHLQRADDVSRLAVLGGLEEVHNASLLTSVTTGLCYLPKGFKHLQCRRNRSGLSCGLLQVRMPRRLLEKG